MLNAPPVVSLTPPGGNLSGTIALGATAVDPLKLAKVDFLVGATLIGTATASPFTVTWDTTTVADGQVMVTARATDVDGNVGSSAATTVTVANAGPVAVTLTQLQTQIFTPICSGCHNGIGTSLPGVQNLSNGHTFASVVNVPSIEQAALDRVKPNDPVNSYLIQKIEGAAGITGSRMPLGCGSVADPCLDQATIDLVKAWISQGALDNSSAGTVSAARCSSPARSRSPCPRAAGARCPERTNARRRPSRRARRHRQTPSFGRPTPGWNPCRRRWSPRDRETERRRRA